MTDAPDMEPAALEAAHKAFERYGQAGDLRTMRLSDGCMSAVISAYLAAAPEAGKAEDVTVWSDEGELAIEWPGRAIISIEGGGIVSYATCDGKKWHPGKVNPFDRPADAADQINAALASSPAHTGAEPVAWPIDRDTLGRMVREAWVRWAKTRPNPKLSWLAPYDELSEPDKEADRQIGETMFLWSKIHLEAAGSLASPQPVAPTGEIAGLVERLKRHYPGEEPMPLMTEAAAALTSLSERIQSSEHALGHEIRIKGEIVTSLRASEAEAASLRTERDNALEELGRVIMACPPGMRTSPASDGVKDLRRKLEEAEQKAERQWEGWVREEAVRKAAERKLEERDKRIAKLEADLAFADEQSAKIEALLEPHVQWECASEGCGKPATVHFVRGDVGSWYCRDCYMRTQAIPAGRTALESDNG